MMRQEKKAVQTKPRACLYSKCPICEIQQPKAIGIQGDLPGEEARAPVLNVL